MNRKQKTKLQRHKELKLLLTKLEVPFETHVSFGALLECAINDAYDAGRLDKEEGK